MILLWMLLQTLAATPQTPTLDLAAMEARALAQHPSVQRAKADVEAAKGRERQAGAWPNPVVGGMAEELRPREKPSGAFGGFVEQAIPLGGKLSAASAMAKRDSDTAEAMLAQTRQEVVANVRAKYYALLLAEERFRVSGQLQELGDESLSTARQLYNVGIADRPDVLMAEAEASRATAALTAATASRVGAWQELAAAVGDVTMAPEKLPSIDDALPGWNAATMLDEVLAESRAVQSAKTEAVAAESAIDVAKSATRPDLFLRGNAGANRERADGRAVGPQFGLELGISVPLFNRNHGGITAATSEAQSARWRVDEVTLDVRSRFAHVFAEYDRARVMVEAYRSDILPKARQAYELHLDKYQQMVAPYPAVLQAQRTLIDLTEQYLDALDRAWAASAALRSSLAIR
jgi:cobalt-zinc-cadmium efflux system outer membrane protein